MSRSLHLWQHVITVHRCNGPSSFTDHRTSDRPSKRVCPHFWGCAFRDGLLLAPCAVPYLATDLWWPIIMRIEQHDGRSSLWLIIVKVGHHDVRSSWRSTIMKIEHNDGRPSWRSTTMMVAHHGHRPPWWSTIMVVDGYDDGPSWWSIIRMVDHHGGRPSWCSAIHSFRFRFWKVSLHTCPNLIRLYMSFNFLQPNNEKKIRKIRWVLMRRQVSLNEATVGS